ncbi:MAG: High-affinity branched-chain amino acid transport system permease protein LivH [Paracidovorax wautersii]|uniref:High-affinity branched-chain amino acid transport system permease protein LivH n=1 Tax=Paracidovorax wautersii TaxID=1177982 RepID=A0A7V8FQI9_9BURK|nr:MAG: High-affinity branched-chain amino acid transport system permease protein LivH [Paracidovorax wautersii]
MNFHPGRWRQWACAGGLAALLALMASAAHALTPEQALAMASGGSADRAEAIAQAVTAPDADARTAAFLQALADDGVKFTEDKVFMLEGDGYVDPATGAAAEPPEDAEDVVNNNYMREEIAAGIAALQLASPDAAVRAQAAASLEGRTDPAKLPLIERALAAEHDDNIREALQRVRASMLLGSDDAAQRLAAVAALADIQTPATKALLNERLRDEDDAGVKQAIAKAIAAIDERLAWGDRLGVLFTGVSLGSILLLAALGLAITYGLMGVINMAHGELIMIGAYATYLVQVLFQRYLPDAFGWYLVVAVPASFMVSAAVGAALERSVIRFLYGRPLETLLATWGISLVLMQGVRSLFGAQNVGVENPAWMSDGLAVLPNLMLPWNRLIIIAFAAAVLLGVFWLIARTRLGLFVRGVTQNRAIASCMGVNTARIDTYAFALGSGIAGLAGCALSQIGNVGPDLGRGYIVDSFLVVVLGGVGQLAGTVYAALGLGIAGKLLEGWSGAVLAKIAVLVLVIVFIQKRPQGIFAVKGRSA